VEVAERYADDLASEVERQASSAAITAPVPAAEVARQVAFEAATAVAFAAGNGDIREAVQEAERSVQAGFVRDIFGPLPFREVHIDSSALRWNDGIVERMAKAIYAERLLPDGTLDNARLAVLADALEEGGIRDGGLLEHLRGPGPHVRGCHVLDAIVGRT
jgi:hypothetical protein